MLDSKLVWSDGPRSLYHGDCREVLKLLQPESFDTLVTDPPYGEGLVAGESSMEEAAELLSEAMKLCYPLMRRGGHAVVFSSSRGLQHTLSAVTNAGFEFRRLLTMHVQQSGARPWRGWLLRSQPIIVAWKPGRHAPAWRESVAQAIREAMDQNGIKPTNVAEALNVSLRLVHKWCKPEDKAWSYPNDSHRAELAAMLGIDIPPQPDDTKSPPARHDVYEVSGLREDKDHPCPKPLWVIEDIVSRLRGNLLDPFCGSGTILEAAFNTSQPCVGIEYDKTFCWDSAKRLARITQRSFQSDSVQMT